TNPCRRGPRSRTLWPRMIRSTPRMRPRQRDAWYALPLAATCALAFLALAWAVRVGLTARADLASRRLEDLAQGWLGALSDLFTLVGDARLEILLVLALGALLWRAGRWRSA